MLYDLFDLESLKDKKHHRSILSSTALLQQPILFIEQLSKLLIVCIRKIRALWKEYIIIITLRGQSNTTAKRE